MKNLKCKAEVEAAEMDGEWVLLDTSNYSITKINEVGGLVWSLLEKSESIESMISKVKEEYGIDEELAKRDILLFLERLIEIGLIDDAA